MPIPPRNITPPTPPPDDSLGLAGKVAQDPPETVDAIYVSGTLTTGKDFTLLVRSDRDSLRDTPEALTFTFGQNQEVLTVYRRAILTLSKIPVRVQKNPPQMPGQTKTPSVATGTEGESKDNTSNG